MEPPRISPRQWAISNERAQGTETIIGRVFPGCAQERSCSRSWLILLPRVCSRIVMSSLPGGAVHRLSFCPQPSLRARRHAPRCESPAAGARKAKKAAPACLAMPRASGKGQHRENERAPHRVAYDEGIQPLQLHIEQTPERPSNRCSPEEHEVEREDVHAGVDCGG